MMSKATSCRDRIVKTARDAILCKVSSARLFSITDGDGLSQSTKSGRIPLLNRIYKFRSTLLHAIVSGILQTSFIGQEFCSQQILILGVGADVSYETTFGNLAKIFAVDFPEIIAERRRTLDGNSCYPHAISIASDLRYADQTMTQLYDAGFDPDRPTIIIIECVLCYIDTLRVASLLAVLATQISRSLLVSYDFVCPRATIDNLNECHREAVDEAANKNVHFSFSSSSSNNFTEMMLNKFSERGAPILHCLSSVEESMAFMRSCGWVHAACYPIQQVSHLFLSQRERTIPAYLEPFDEFASLAILHRHYTITLASTCRPWFDAALSHLIERVPPSSMGGRDSTYSTSSSKQSTSVNLEVRGSFHGNIPTGALRIEKLQHRLAAAEARLRSLASLFPCATLRTQSRDEVSQSRNRDSRTWTFQLRRASGSDDSRAVRELFQSCFEGVSRQFTPVLKFVKRAARALEDIDREYQTSSGSAFWVAEKQKDASYRGAPVIVGCVGVKVGKGVHAGRRIELRHMCVSPAFRRRRIARSLLSTAIEHCREVSTPSFPSRTDEEQQKQKQQQQQERTQEKYERVLELSVLTVLEAARSLYLSMGFEVRGSVDLGGGCVLEHMQLNLSKELN